MDIEPDVWYLLPIDIWAICLRQNELMLAKLKMFPATNIAIYATGLLISICYWKKVGIKNRSSFFPFCHWCTVIRDSFPIYDYYEYMGIYIGTAKGSLRINIKY